MTAEFVMVPCPVCCRERTLPITAKYSVWKTWQLPCLFCKFQFVDGDDERWLPAKILVTS